MVGVSMHVLLCGVLYAWENCACYLLNSTNYTCLSFACRSMRLRTMVPALKTQPITECLELTYTYMFIV